MTQEVETKIEQVRAAVRLEQAERHRSGEHCVQRGDEACMDGLVRRVIPYVNGRGGCGYGIEFEFVAEDGSKMVKAFDEGFIDAAGVPTGHVANHDWREKKESLLV